MLGRTDGSFRRAAKAVQNLLAVANLKSDGTPGMADRDPHRKGDQIRFTMFERAKADPAGIELLVKKRAKGK